MPLWLLGWDLESKAPCSSATGSMFFSHWFYQSRQLCFNLFYTLRLSATFRLKTWFYSLRKKSWKVFRKKKIQLIQLALNLHQTMLQSSLFFQLYHTILHSAFYLIQTFPLSFIQNIFASLPLPYQQYPSLLSIWILPTQVHLTFQGQIQMLALQETLGL